MHALMVLHSDDERHERSRDGRPVCFSCGMSGHYQNSFPQRSNRERQQVSRYMLPAPDTSMRALGFLGGELLLVALVSFTFFLHI